MTLLAALRTYSVVGRRSSPQSHESSRRNQAGRPRQIRGGTDSRIKPTPIRTRRDVHADPSDVPNVAIKSAKMPISIMSRPRRIRHVRGHSMGSPPCDACHATRQRYPQTEVSGTGTGHRFGQNRVSDTCSACHHGGVLKGLIIVAAVLGGDLPPEVPVASLRHGRAGAGGGLGDHLVHRGE